MQPRCTRPAEHVDAAQAAMRPLRRRELSVTRRVLNRFVDTHNPSTRIRYARSLLPRSPRLYRYAPAATGNSAAVLLAP